MIERLETTVSKQRAALVDKRLVVRRLRGFVQERMDRGLPVIPDLAEALETASQELEEMDAQWGWTV